MERQAARCSAVYAAEFKLPEESKRYCPDKDKSNLHRYLKLSHFGQANRHADLTTSVSPSFVFAGSHCPIIVRLVESLWAHAVTIGQPASSLRSTISLPGRIDSGGGGPATPLTTEHGSSFGFSISRLAKDPEIISKQRLTEALRCLPVNPHCVAQLGQATLTDPLDDLISGSSSSDAGQPSRPKTSSTRRPRRLVGLTPLRAPPAKPLPALLSGQPMIVCFIGGCTLAEVAALRFVAERRQWHLMMATTSLLHTRDLIQHVSQAAINKWP